MKTFVKLILSAIAMMFLALSCSKEPSQPKVAVNGVTISPEVIDIEIGDQKPLTVTVFPSDATNKNISFSSSRESVATVSQDGIVEAVSAGKAIVTVTTEDGKYKANCTVTVNAAYQELIDLGLSVKWASCNLGATKPEDYGGYYQWAGLEDVTDKSICLDWNHCPYHSALDENPGWAKYNTLPDRGTVDYKNVLDPEDDVAHIRLGGNWRMPTEEEWQELKNTSNCSWTWTTINGINGYKVQSKKAGFTDNWIFLPAAGSRIGYVLSDNGFVGIYWSSSLFSYDSDSAIALPFSSGGVSQNGSLRFNGVSIRPVFGERVRVTGVSLDRKSLTLCTDQWSKLTATVTPANAPEKGIIWTSSDNSVATVDYVGNVKAVSLGAATIIAKTVDGEFIAECELTVKSPELKAVDLGLPSGIKWADCNLGAYNPEDIGGYYQWAGLENVTSTGIYPYWDNCPYHTGSNRFAGWMKYNTEPYIGSVDNKTVLDPEDDVAHVKLGGNWRMPTEEEFKELIDNCTSEWTTLNEINGTKFTSMKNGNSIFLPATGYHDYDDLYCVGSYGYYWSSSLRTDIPYSAYCLSFGSDNVVTCDYERFFGLVVRPVSE